MDHQRLRTAAIKIIRALGIEGGCNIQFAFDPEHQGVPRHRGEPPRVQVVRPGLQGDRLSHRPGGGQDRRGQDPGRDPNKITGKTAAAFEPTIDYVVVKIPRWPFDKFRTVDKRLGTQMKSTGEVMAIGRTIEEGIMKAIRSLEIDRSTWRRRSGPTR